MTAHQIKPRPSSLHRPTRDHNYLAWLKRRPCDCCGKYRPGQMDPAHTGSRGAGTRQKADDHDAITLYHDCHVRYHQIGERAFLEERGLDLVETRKRARAQYEKRRAA